MGRGMGWLEAEAQETGGSQGQTTAWSSPPQALCSGGLRAPECDGAPGPPGGQAHLGNIFSGSTQGQHSLPARAATRPSGPPSLECSAQLSLARVLGLFTGSTGLWVTDWKKWRVRTRSRCFEGCGQGVVDSFIHLLGCLLSSYYV